MGIPTQHPLHEQLFYSEEERFLFFKQGHFYLKYLLSPALSFIYAFLNYGTAQIVTHPFILS